MNIIVRTSIAAIVDENQPKLATDQSENAFEINFRIHLRTTIICTAIAVIVKIVKCSFKLLQCSIVHSSIRLLTTDNCQIQTSLTALDDLWHTAARKSHCGQYSTHKGAGIDVDRAGPISTLATGVWP